MSWKEILGDYSGVIMGYSQGGGPRTPLVGNPGGGPPGGDSPDCPPGITGIPVMGYGFRVILMGYGLRVTGTRYGVWVTTWEHLAALWQRGPA